MQDGHHARQKSASMEWTEWRRGDATFIAALRLAYSRKRRLFREEASLWRPCRSSPTSQHVPGVWPKTPPAQFSASINRRCLVLHRFDDLKLIMSLAATFVPQDTTRFATKSIYRTGHTASLFLDQNHGCELGVLASGFVALALETETFFLALCAAFAFHFAPTATHLPVRY